LKKSASFDALFAFGVSLVCQKYFVTKKPLNILTKSTLKSVSKAIRFGDFSYETAYETNREKVVNDEKGLFLLLIKT
jgi:hypothetical protein